MKAVGIILIILCLIAGGGILYLYFNANVSVAYVDCVASDPMADPDRFAEIKRQVEQGTFPGVRLSKDPLTIPEDYVFYTWTVKVTNDTFLTAKSVELQITTRPEDILIMPDDQEYVIKSKSSGLISVTCLTKRNTHNIREATVSWYLGGLHFPTVPNPITLGN